MEYILIHEIGHYIHSKYFKEKYLEFNVYCFKRENECFAENFTDYVYLTVIIDKDLMKMDILLKSNIK